MDKDNIEQQIKEHWFKDHVAEFTKLNDRVCTISWGRSNSNYCYTRYVFDGSKLYISGDLGEAIFSLTEKASIESVSSYDIHYFHGKLSAFCEDKYSFDSDKAIARIKEEIEEVSENKEIDNAGIGEENDYILVLNDLITESKSCCNRDEWVYRVGQEYDELSNYDPDVSEWIFSAGNVIPSRIKGYLIGLKMAYEQMKSLKEYMEEYMEEGVK